MNSYHDSTTNSKKVVPIRSAEPVYTFKNNGGNDDGDGMESRVSVLEEKSRTIESNIGDIKTNIRSILIVSITLLLAIAGAFYGVSKDLHSTELKIITLDYKAEKIQTDVGSLTQEVREIKSDITSIKSSLDKLSASVDKLANDKK
ncbi:hypothetical protein [Nitrosomonas oligotropha]|uniref:hypothetical protein n=1 Tax=Nitrosomonas oligotropha TaxID=42354 RepID=UPI00136D8A20|nr:hypothetical protein [Nitrosomonas oligotropha]MXS81549.1 hypothetical protein [Nitrosomonas oligotropha]